MIKRYNKLVRDRIPEIIRAGGQVCETQVLDEEEYLKALDRKLFEELAEYRADGNPEELADLLEVLLAAALARGVNRETLEEIRAEKERARGGFHGRILLKSVGEGEEPPDTYYHDLCRSLESLIRDVPHKEANLANAAALLFNSMKGVNWAGFYLTEKDLLYLGPFQGKPACIEIPFGKGRI